MILDVIIGKEQSRRKAIEAVQRKHHRTKNWLQKIPRPNGSAGRTKNGYCLKDEIGLQGQDCQFDRYRVHIQPIKYI